jgi:hypothetical protein
VCEIFGCDVVPDNAVIGVGVHPFADPRIIDDFSRVTVPIDAREFHVYAAEWTPYVRGYRLAPAGAPD